MILHILILQKLFDLFNITFYHQVPKKHNVEKEEE